MLYLNSPYFVINGVSIFPDDKDPLQWYYLPMMPHLTQVTDPSTNVATPQISLIEYRGAAGNGGFINFDVNIGIEQDALNAVSGQLQQQAKLTSQPRLSPITFVDGTVNLLILGAQSAPSTVASNSDAAGTGSAGTSTAVATAVAAPAASGPQFVVKVQNATKPALYGDNQATFSVQLDQYGATVMEAALKGEMAPIAVIYSLQFLGLRPAFHVSLQADWNRVQTYLDSQYSGGFLFVSSDIEKTVDKLIENQVITIKVDSFTTDTELGASGVSDRDRAVSECYELVKTNFFQSSLAPPDPNKPDDWAGVNETMKNISDIALGGGASTACFSYKHIDISRTDQKSLNFDLTEQSAVLRTIYPQGHLSGLLKEISPDGTGLAKFITQVDLDDPYFARRKVNVMSPADFDGDAIAQIDVNLTYNGSSQSVTLAAAATAKSIDWSSLLSGGQMQRPVSYDYVVTFKGVDTSQRPGQLKSGALITSDDVLVIEPRGDLYAISIVPVRAFGFPWDRYPSVEIECRYVDAKNAINELPSAVLTGTNPEVDWPLFMCDPTQRSFDYRLTYSLASGGTTVTPWTTTSEAKIDVVDPFPAKINLIIIAALDWTQFTEALVFVAYPSKANPKVQQSYTLTAAAPSAPPLEIDRQDPTQTMVYYEARLIRTNGQVWTVPGSVTADNSLIIQDQMKGHQIVSVVPQAVDFNAAQIQQIVVGLRYVDTANAINTTESVTIASASDVRSFSYDYINPAIGAEYSAGIQLTNGQTKTLDWAPIGGSALIIPLNLLS